MTKQTETFEQINQRVLASVKVNRGFVEWFAPIMKTWQKPFGAKPSPEMLTAAVLLTSKYQQPGIECLHIAMCLRPEGCSVLQYTNAAISGLGRVVGPANNKRKALIAARMFSVTVEGKPYAFKLAFTTSAEKALAHIQAVAANNELLQPTPKAKKPAKGPSKPVREPKAKQATQQPATETPTSKPPTATEGVVTVPQSLVDRVTETEQAVETEVMTFNPEPVETPNIGGVEPEHDQVNITDIQALANHFNS